MALDVLAISPHPDDVELFCGGTLSLLVHKGYAVGIADLTEGELSTRGTVQIRKAEAEAARQALAIPVRINTGIKDGGLVSTRDNINKVIEIIRQHRPKWLLCPWKWDRHPDHEDAFHLVRKAAFQAGLHKLKVDGAAFRPQGILYYPGHWVPEPSFVVDISDHLDRKYKAIACYKSQFFPSESDDPETYISRPKFLEDLKVRDRYWGSQIGVEAGEPWIVERPLGIADPITLMESLGTRTP
jgi:bacillithiol biosynthesis deacetylase BshB1